MKKPTNLQIASQKLPISITICSIVNFCRGANSLK